MNVKTTISATEARGKFNKILKEVQKKGVYYTLTLKGRPSVVIMSAKEHEELVNRFLIS